MKPEPCIYFARCGDTGPIKIGYTSRHSEIRRRELVAKNGQPFRILGVIPAMKWREREIHRRFARARLDAEWFEATEDLLSFIAAEADEPVSSAPVAPRQKGKRRGRPPGRQWPNHISIYLSDEQIRGLEALAWKERRPLGYVAREMIARQLGKAKAGGGE